MRLFISSALAVGLVATAAAQQFLVDQLSFGYTGRINDRGQQTVPNFSIQGNPDTPLILSNKVILTPPHPGNARAAIWGDGLNKYRTWTTDVDFRVNGPERGGGNLNIWLVRDGVKDIGTSSIYTVEKFDGLALVVDRYGSGAGMIRGFLNDGNINFRNHPSVDSLAFGHCDYSYRNLGRPSQIKMRQTPSSFKVEIDGQTCFESPNIAIPPGYTFGITAASAENPDSFEVFKMVVMTENLSEMYDTPAAQQQQRQQQGRQDQSQFFAGSGSSGSGQQQPVAAADSAFENDMPERAADSITNAREQFKDMHDRLQGINRHMSTMFRLIADLSAAAMKGREESSSKMGEIKGILSKLDKLQQLDKLDRIQNQLDNLERELKKLDGRISNHLDASERRIKALLGNNHGSMLEHVATTSGSSGSRLIFIVVFCQAVVVVGYIIYERKRTSPKKYL